jgi:hypothetical protein
MGSFIVICSVSAVKFKKKIPEFVSLKIDSFSDSFIFSKETALPVKSKILYSSEVLTPEILYVLFLIFLMCNSFININIKIIFI